MCCCSIVGCSKHSVKYEFASMCKQPHPLAIAGKGAVTVFILHVFDWLSLCFVDVL